MKQIFIAALLFGNKVHFLFHLLCAGRLWIWEEYPHPLGSGFRDVHPFIHVHFYFPCSGSGRKKGIIEK